MQSSHRGSFIENLGILENSIPAWLRLRSLSGAFLLEGMGHSLGKCIHLVLFLLLHVSECGRNDVFMFGFGSLFGKALSNGTTGSGVGSSIVLASGITSSWL